VAVDRDAGRIENFVSIDIDNGPDNTVTLFSGYFKYRTPTMIHVVALEGVLSTAHSHTLIALDANAFSKRWYSRVNDHRGVVLIDFVDARDLKICNRRCEHYTFDGPRGRTNIDVTLADDDTSRKINMWRIVPGVTNSDHQLVHYNLDLILRSYVHPPTRYVVQGPAVGRF